MVTQYPHIIIIPGSVDETYRENGIWKPGASGSDIQQACRYEPSAITKKLAVADGTVIEYKGIVYLPKSTPDIENGSFIEIPGVLEKSKALYFYRGQMNCTLYIL